jgi:hypothetical protein
VRCAQVSIPTLAANSPSAITIFTPGPHFKDPTIFPNSDGYLKLALISATVAATPGTGDDLDPAGLLPSDRRRVPPEVDAQIGADGLA